MSAYSRLVRPFHSVPRAVRCNRGFGWYFWMTMAILGVVTLIAVAALWSSGPAEAVPVLGIGVIAVVIVVAVRAFVLPSLEINLTDGVLRARRRTTRLSALTAVSITDHGRAGVWAEFAGVDGKRVARMSISGTLFASPDSVQWTALRYAIHQAAGSGGAWPGMPAPIPDGQISAGAVLEILDAQISWCQAGNRSASRRAPAAALINRRTAFLS